MIPKLTIIAILCIFNAGNGQELPNHLAADNNGVYDIYWGVEEEIITFQLEVKTTGYVGFGISKTGTMVEADIIIAWVYPNGTSVFHDRKGLGFYEPLIDSEQNYQLLSAIQNGTHTIIRFSRPLNTCDKQNDSIINDDTTKLIFSWHPDDPPAITGLPYHGPDRRGSRQVYLLSPQPPPVTITDDIVVWEMHMPNLTIPKQRTTYWCYYTKLPDYDVAMDYIGFEVDITPGNENIVHHFLFMACTVNLDRYKELIKTDGYQCIYENTLAEPMECQPPLMIWAYGSKGQMLPDGVGIPIGEKSGGATYFGIQMHYNNVQLKEGVKDSSGFKMFLSKKRRPITAATLQFYSPADYTVLIPPKQPEFRWTTYCATECTQQAFPPEGVNVFAVGLHAHLTGRKIYLKHFRGKQELPPISFDDNYDFDYQEMRQLKAPVNVLPGDVLMAECTYNTSARDMTTVGGYSTLQEMCFLYVSYYPAVPLSLCIGGPSVDEISKYFGVKIGPDLLHIESPPEHFNKSMIEFVEGYDWSQVSDEKLELMRAMQYNATKYITCQDVPVTKEGTRTYPVPFPSDATFYVAPDECAAKRVETQKPTGNVYTKAPPKDSYYKPPTTPPAYY